MPAACIVVCAIDETIYANRSPKISAAISRLHICRYSSYCVPFVCEFGIFIDVYVYYNTFRLSMQRIFELKILFHWDYSLTTHVVWLNVAWLNVWLLSSTPTDIHLTLNNGDVCVFARKSMENGLFVSVLWWSTTALYCRSESDQFTSMLTVNFSMPKRKTCTLMPRQKKMRLTISVGLQNKTEARRREKKNYGNTKNRFTFTNAWSFLSLYIPDVRFQYSWKLVFFSPSFFFLFPFGWRYIFCYFSFLAFLHKCCYFCGN